jgi:hypothetical protein
MLEIYSPGYIEELFKAIAAGQSNDEIPALAEKFGLVVVGPTLLEGIFNIGSPRA